MFELRRELSDVTNDQSFVQREKDPSEFLKAFETLFHYAPLRTIQSGQRPSTTPSNVTTNIVCKYCIIRSSVSQ